MCVCVYGQTACALQFLHEQNISHLDLKPQNILLSGSVLKLAGESLAAHTRIQTQINFRVSEIISPIYHTYHQVNYCHTMQGRVGQVYILVCMPHLHL